MGSAEPLASRRWAGLACGETARARAAAVPSAVAAEPQPFFTHHQILALVAPFARSGHRIDMAASRRLQRQLVFQPVPREGAEETLRLESPRPGFYRLLRTLKRADGLSATLQASGAQPEALLQQVQAVPPQQHFSEGEGFTLAQSLHLGPDGATEPTAAVLQTEALRLKLQVPCGRSASVPVALHARNEVALALPDDLLAVLGWDWSTLQVGPEGWCGSLRLRGEGASRLHDLGAKLETAARHLVRTLAEPPRRFHERLAAARVAVWLRRALPLLAVAGMGAHVAFVGPLLALPDAASAWRAVLPLLPPALLALFFLRSEGPRLEIPRWPRAAALGAWLRR